MYILWVKQCLILVCYKSLTSNDSYFINHPHVNAKILACGHLPSLRANIIPGQKNECNRLFRSNYYSEKERGCRFSMVAAKTFVYHAKSLFRVVVPGIMALDCHRSIQKLISANRPCSPRCL